MIVLVHDGLKLSYLCRGLADCNFQGTVAVIGREPNLPYERPALSKGYLLKGGFPVSNFYTCAGVCISAMYYTERAY